MSATTFSDPSAESTSNHAQPTNPSSLYSNSLLPREFYQPTTTIQVALCLLAPPIAGCQCIAGKYRCSRKRDTIEQDLRQFAALYQSLSSHVQPTTTPRSTAEHELPFYSHSLNDEGVADTEIMPFAPMTTSSPYPYTTRSSTFFSMTSNPLSSTFINTPTLTADGELHSAGRDLDNTDTVAASNLSISSFCLIVFLLVFLWKSFFYTKKAFAAQRQSMRMIDEAELGFTTHENHAGPQKMG